jgi:hypothetical protein
VGAHTRSHQEGWAETWGWEGGFLTQCPRPKELEQCSWGRQGRWEACFVPTRWEHSSQVGSVSYSEWVGMRSERWVGAAPVGGGPISL